MTNWSDKNKNQVYTNSIGTDRKIIRQFIYINYPDATIDGDKVCFIKARRKRSADITAVIYELNIIGFDVSYKLLKSILEVK